MSEPVKIGPRPCLWCVRKACQQAKTCRYAHNCKAMTHEAAKAAQDKWAADKQRRDADAAERERLERDERQLRLLSYEQKLNAAGLDLGELIELIEARKDGNY